MPDVELDWVGAWVLSWLGDRQLKDEVGNLHVQGVVQGARISVCEGSGVNLCWAQDLAAHNLQRELLSALWLWRRLFPCRQETLGMYVKHVLSPC